MSQKRFKHKFGREFWANCLLVVLSLWLRCRLTKIKLHRGKDGYHWVGRTNRGHMVHFKKLGGWERNRLFFRGRLEVKRWVWA